MLPETEKSVLAMALDRNALASVLFENLPDDYFHGPCLIIYRAMFELQQDGMDLRWPTVRDRVGAAVHASFWASMMETTRGIHESGYAPYLMESIQRMKTDRGRRAILKDIEGVAGKAELEAEDIEHMGERVHAMRLIGRSMETPGLSAALGAYHEHIRQEASSITTGIPSFDYRINGFNAGELVTIMARAGVGKTFFALNLINHLAGRVPFNIALFSLEMPKSAIVERMLEVYFGMSRLEVRERALDGSLYMPDFEARFEKLKIYDKIYSASEIRKIVEAEGYRVVFIDFLHLIRSEVIGNPYQQISQVIADLKRMAKDTGSVAFLLHQLSRQAGSGWTRVEAAHARDSGQIEELSDFLFGVWAPGLDPSAPAEAENDLSIRLIKNKRGERWTAACQFDKNCGRIGEIEREVQDGYRPTTARSDRDFSCGGSGCVEGD